MSKRISPKCTGNISRRKLILGAGTTLLGTSLGGRLVSGQPGPAMNRGQTMLISMWGGPFSKAIRETLAPEFEKDHGVKIAIEEGQSSDTLAKLRTERHIELVVIGRLKEGGPSARIIDELGLRDAVTFITGVPEERIIELYSEAQVAVVPSLYEGFSLPAIEAMSCGVPLVATSGGALPEVVGNHNETALVVPPGDSEALAAMLRTALDDPALRDRIGAAGRQRVIDRWTWRHTATGTVEHYRALLAETPHIQARRPGGAGAAPRFQRSRVTRPGS